MGKKQNLYSIFMRIHPIWICAVIITFVGIAALAMNSMESTKPPSPQIVKVDLSPIRGDFEPLRLRRGGFEYKCSECHRLFESPIKQEKRVAEHTGLILDHGRNNYCFNCHHKTNRDAYTDYDGSEIPSGQPARLCAKCHGTTYRDWEVGVHGKISGGWEPTQRDGKRVLCIQCHDPHSPKFPSLKPMPGPAHGRVRTAGGEA